MLEIKQIFEMEKQLKNDISVGFFEHGKHSDMDLTFYEAYSAVQTLRMMWEEREKGIRKEAECLKKEVAALRGELDTKNENRAYLNEVSFSEEDVHDIKGCSVCRISEGVGEDGEEILFITLFSPLNEQYLMMQIGGDGRIFITGLYSDIT